MVFLCRDFPNFLIAVIYFGLPDYKKDSKKEYTRASLVLPTEVPWNFTICGAYMVDAWPAKGSSGYVFNLKGQNFEIFLKVYASITNTTITVRIGEVEWITKYKRVFFLLTWMHACVSLDSASLTAVLVVDGQVLTEKQYPSYLHEFDPMWAQWLSYKVIMHLGSRSEKSEAIGMVSMLNMFSFPLSKARMVAITETGNNECGTPGDVISWEEADWQLHSEATLKPVDNRNYNNPCRWDSKMNAYTAEFSKHQTCMEHCPKLGNGRSPPLRTEEEWNSLRERMLAIDPYGGSVIHRKYTWLAATDEEKEGVWRDYYYPHEKIDTNWTWPWDSKGDTKYGEEFNCMTTRLRYGVQWREWQCASVEKKCVCQYEREPILHLRGLCSNSPLVRFERTRYTPKQLGTSDIDNDVFFVGEISTEIRYNDSSEQWVISDSTSDVIAESKASKVSYALGKHEWTIYNDVLSCSKGKPYTTLLKLSGCKDGEFTCNDGQCVTMEQRCDQISDCIDESDEVDCKLLTLKSNYNRKTPPIVPKLMGGFNPAQVDISISLLKIVSMEEVQHKIDFKFRIILEWKENRAVYYNLKDDPSLNALTDADISNMWLPYVIYDNTDMTEAVRLEDGLKTTVVVNRDGSLTRTKVDVLDEIEIFEGKANRLSMFQTYTKSFQCQYHLQRYPFDTQASTN